MARVGFASPDALEKRKNCLGLADWSHVQHMMGLEPIASIFFHVRTKHEILPTGSDHVGGRETIDRSASESAKGPRLQKLRASLFLVEALADENNTQAYVAIETDGDVLFTCATNTTSLVYSEEDKNFGDNTSDLVRKRRCDQIAS